ncbi:DUF3857 domain-containing protein [Anaeromyxobacter dehalogenans]|uniref:Tetratricopeptide repeat protein n=1 Tax=Anaeromyxobacter dehalogenans (strain 2CP-C) TaxID=290397 RepID=Q2IN83_ANADE|nr:DUF3857 domain-containing protein [Anaeromyxobacter dehalogenans]ABC80262.1 hypothetical protein Adeh_0486 [Anaeromyxobacter dehalogenans 2CP-C]
MTLRLLPALAAASLSLLAARAGAAGAPWEGAPFSADPKAMLAAAQALAPPRAAGVDVLLEEGRFRYDARGALTLEHRLVFRLLTAEAARSWSRVERSYAPWQQARPELRARVITAQGEVHELDPATLTEQGVADRADLMYSDRRVVAGPLPAVRVGSLVEELIVVRDTAPSFDGGTSARFFLAQALPARRIRVEVAAPAELPLRWVVRGTDAAPKETKERGERRLVIDRRDVPGWTAVEPGAPRDTPPAPYLAFGWGRSWADVSARYAASWERQLAGSGLAAAAREALGEGQAPDRAEAVRRVVAWVHRNVRYTGLELGEAALVPAAPDEVLKRRYGDCKDLSLLVAGMLRAAGHDARLALVRTDWHEVNPELPGISQFDHVVVRVEGSPAIWVDATDPYTPPGVLPPAVEGRLALVTPGGRELVRTPERGAADNRVRIVRELFMAESGRGRIRETRELVGALAATERAFRERIPPERRDEVAEHYAKEVLRAAEVLSASTEGLDDPSAPLRLVVDAKETDAVRTADDEAELPVTPDQVFDALPGFLTGDPEGHGAAPPAKRTADLLLVVPYQWEVTYRIHVPDGFEPRPLPASTTERFGPATYAQTYARAPDGTVTATFRFDTGGRRLSAADAAALGKRAREVVRGSSPVVALDRTAAALLAAGKVPEALGEMRRLAALHPKEALHHVQLAAALVRLGFSEQAATEVRQAIALEPDSAWAHRILGWILQHDAVGRYQGPGHDRAGALAAYRKAKDLDPDHAGGRAALAELLAREANGAPAATIGEAVEEFEAIRADLHEQAFDGPYLRTLFDAGRDAGAEKLARDMPRGRERDGLLLAAVAMQRGAPAAEEESRGMGDGRRDALRDAARLMVGRRSYAAAAALASAAAQGAPNAAEIRQQADLFQGLKPWETLAPQGTEAARLVKRLFVAAIRSPAPARELPGMVARDRLGPELVRIADQGLGGPIAGARRTLHEQGIPPDVLLDLVLSRVEMLEDGDPRAAVRVRVQFPFTPGDGRSAVFVVREGKEPKVLATDTAWPILGAEALRLAGAGDLAGARRWLDWARETLPGAESDPSTPAGVLARLWRPGAEAGAPEVRRAAAAVLAWADEAGRSIPTLSEARARATDPAERRALGFALAQAYRAAGKREDQLRVARELLQDDPASREAFALGAVALADLKRPAELEALAAGVLQRLPDDPEVLGLLGNLRLGAGNVDEAAKAFRRLIDGGKASPLVLNNAAWLELFRATPGKDALDWARRAVEGERGQNHPSLNTLAAIYAASGQPAEAREVFLRSLDVSGDALEPADWFVFGRIAEAWGVPEAARAAYARVAPDPLDPTAPHTLAQRRLALLGPAPAPASPGGAKPAPGDAPAVPPARPLPAAAPAPAAAPPATPAAPARPEGGQPGKKAPARRKPAPPAPKAPAAGARPA